MYVMLRDTHVTLWDGGKLPFQPISQYCAMCQKRVEVMYLRGNSIFPSQDRKPRCRWRRRCRCRRFRCPSVCNEFLCGKYDILSGVWLSVSCVCNEFLCITTLTVWQYVLEWFYLGRAQTASALQRAESVNSSKSTFT